MTEYIMENICECVSDVCQTQNLVLRLGLDLVSGLVIGLVRVRIRPGVGFYKQNPPKTLFSFL